MLPTVSIGIGDALGVKEPFPSSPELLLPQQKTRASVSELIAQLCAPPAAITSNGPPLATSKGTLLGAVVPLPNCPDSLAPQHTIE
jgi:hypothetical protein